MAGTKNTGEKPQNMAVRGILSLHAFAQAKINLSLRIVGRRPDGFHELQSLFVPLPFGDRIVCSFAEAASSSLTCRCLGAFARQVDPKNNLIIKAARLVVKPNTTYSFVLHKWIPVAAGLGGGSSDAAAVLKMLAPNHKNLQKLARTLGADVPYFLNPTPCFMGGIGDIRLQDCQLPRLHLLLVNPGVPLLTQDVFRGFRGPLTPRNALGNPPPAFKTLEDLAEIMVNDLESTAEKLVSEIGEIKQALMDEKAMAVVMSGSGPTVVGLFASRQKGREAKKAMRQRFSGFFIRLFSI